MSEERMASDIHDSVLTPNRYFAYIAALAKRFEESPCSTVEKLETFPKYVPRGTLARFLAKLRIFELALPVHGSVFECGVHLGGGLFTWAQLSAILEPANHQRRIVGFDTFAGFPEGGVSSQDLGRDPSPECVQGGMAASSYDELLRCIECYDLVRYMNHFPKIQLVQGDFMETLPAYLAHNPHTIVSLLYLDFDLHDPTELALSMVLPLMPKGAVVAFDQLGHPSWPGETQAVIDQLGIHELALRGFPFGTSICYAVLE